MSDTPRPAPELPSFWMGGYEGADHVNAAGEALDLVAATGHDARLDADYRAARRLGLRCLRESIGWRLAERPDGSFDLARPRRMAEAAARQGVHILWTLMHYGVPPGLTLFDDALVPRFARFAAAVARELAAVAPAPRIYTPINEISFLSWAASATPDMGPAGAQTAAAVEDSRISGYQLKRRLVRAALAGMQAIREVDPEARFLHIDPVLHVAPGDAANPHQVELARRIAGYQWQAFDMLVGRLDPELGGHPAALDLVGLNHYHSSQWEVPSEKRLPWHLRDARRRPLGDLLGDVWRRYGRPMILAETGHLGVGRAAWLHDIAGEARRARAAGVPLQGVCLYPLLDRPDWHDPRRWHRSGLWHIDRPEQPRQRCLNRPYARALAQWQAPAAPASGRPGLLVLLPCAWEDWRAPREALLARLAAGRPLLLLEPPRPHSGAASDEALLREHTLGPGATLLVLHGRHAAGWASAPAALALTLLRAALRQRGAPRWVCWLAGWRGDGHAGWWRELQGDGLILQPDPLQPPFGELLARARGRLPALWPPPAPRAARAGSYEAEEITRLLGGVAEPRVWLAAPPHPPELRRLQALAEACPALQLLVDAPPPPGPRPAPPNLHWLGRVHDSLLPTLAAAVQRTVPWAGPPGWAELDAAPPVAEHEPDLEAALRTLAAMSAGGERLAAGK